MRYFVAESFLILTIATVIFSITPNCPVTIAGDTISENRVVRDGIGQVIAIDLSDMGLSNSKILKYITPFKSTIQVLDLSKNTFKELDLSYLENSINLHALNISSNRIKKIDLKPLSRVENLCRLMMSENKIEEIDLTPLSNCIQLKNLQLQFNRIKEIDISCLSSCSKLRTLWLYNNQLEQFDLESIVELRSLEDIKLGGNDFDNEFCIEIEDFLIDNPLLFISYDCD